MAWCCPVSVDTLAPDIHTTSQRWATSYVSLSLDVSLDLLPSFSRSLSLSHTHIHASTNICTNSLFPSLSVFHPHTHVHTLWRTHKHAHTLTDMTASIVSSIACHHVIAKFAGVLQKNTPFNELFRPQSRLWYDPRKRQYASSSIYYIQTAAGYLWAYLMKSHHVFLSPWIESRPGDVTVSPHLLHWIIIYRTRYDIYEIFDNTWHSPQFVPINIKIEDTQSSVIMKLHNVTDYHSYKLAKAW